MEIDSPLMAAVLDTIIPPSEEGGMPGAGRLDLGETMREAAGDVWPILAEGMRALDERARDTGGTGFAELDLDERSELLGRSTESHPALLPSLVFHTYTAYYRNPVVVEALGLEARPPYPLGYTLEAGNPDLLEPVRRREPFYRKAE